MNPRWKHAAGALGLALTAALALGACKEARTGLRFSHARHAADQGCAECHRGETLRTGMEPCKACHEIDEKAPSEACLTCHTRPDGQGYAVAPAARGRSYGDLRFDHGPHGDVACDACHPGAAGAATLAAVSFPRMEACLACHDGATAPAACATCHQTLRRDERPPSHGALWERRHGQTADPSARVCGFCHEGRDACRSCHLERQPRSHTPAWGERSHGLQARHDPDACRTCHTASYCSDCHQETPRSHRPRAGWLASGHRLRGAVAGDGCRVCHRPAEPSCTPCHPSGF
ncbi:MAG: hypothetical protein ACYDA8_01985 [Deferrisomatales bacterium]